MNILILHPDDSFRLALAKGPWDTVLDLGAIPGSPEQSAQIVLPMPKVQFEDLRTIKQIFGLGLGSMVDRAGFDWWDLLCVEFYQPVLELLRLRRFVQGYPPQARFTVTRPSLHSRLLQALCPGRVQVLATPFSARLRERARRARRLRPRQILQILADKYDGEYRARHFLTPRAELNSTPVVLLPSAYGNASRTALAYAGVLPDVRFLLVTTRASGQVRPVPANVNCESLAAFASGAVNRRELQLLLETWRSLVTDFESDANLALLARAGCFDSVPDWLRQGLAIRDAWLEVFASQPVASVLCTDEMNWHTGLPLLIARSRNLPAVACHHGALDLRYSFRETSADRFLAKGVMEWDYLVNSCGMNEEKIEIAAPAMAPAPVARSRGTSIIFFSEPYEAFGGRCSGYYQQVLPGLANLARQHGCELVLKLHPFESRRERSRWVSNFLPADLRPLVRIVDGPLNDELMGAAWFGVTVTSSAVVDCGLRGIPIFLCRWLDFSATGYAEQFVRLGAAKGLSSADQIEKIPGMLRNYVAPDVKNLWQMAGPERLRELILERTLAHEHPYEPSIAERAWA